VHDVVREIDGIPLNSPNDVCLDADGNLYFTDPGGPGTGAVCFFSPGTGEARRLHTGWTFLLERRDPRLLPRGR
jgi:sugar lactone lactonase YvrE